MRLRIQDDVYEVDTDRITVAEAKTFKRHSGGMGAYELRQGLLRGDPDVMVFMCWLAKTRAGEKRITWASFDDLDLVSDVEVLIEDDDAADADQAEGTDDETSGESRADPTGPDGPTRRGGSSPTSRRSRSSSASARAKSTT